MTEENETLGPRDAAEDYRQQRQSSAARKAGMESIGRASYLGWLNNNDNKLREIALANGASNDDIDAILNEYMSSVEATPKGSDHDDPNAYLIIKPLIDEIEEVCLSGEIPIRSGVVFGVSPELGLKASQMPVLGTEASIIDVSLPFIPFCSFISKVLALSLPVRAEADGWRVSNDQKEVEFRLKSEPEISQQWLRVIAAYAESGWPPEGSIITMPNAITSSTRILLLKAMELFAVAHEYGHHVLKHGLADSTLEEIDHFRDEHDADGFARIISLVRGASSAPPNLYAMSGVGGVVMLGSLELVTRAKAVLRSGCDQIPPRRRHPPFKSRIEYIGNFDQLVPEEHRPAFADLRSSFVGILEIVWEQIKPLLLHMHNNGVRPLEDAPDPGGWLPLHSYRETC